MITLVFFGLLSFLLLILAIKSTCLVQQAEVIVIERLGEFNKILTSGLNFIIPFVIRHKRIYITFNKCELVLNHCFFIQTTEYFCSKFCNADGIS